VSRVHSLHSGNADMLALLHTTSHPHVHPDQMAVALLFFAVVYSVTWALSRRRS